MSNGCNDTNMDFRNSVYLNNSGAGIQGSQTNAPSDGSCALFAPNGANMTPVIAPLQAVDIDSAAAKGVGEFLPGHGAVRIYQIKGVGTDGTAGTQSANDIIFVQKYLNKSVCLAINDILGINNNGEFPPSATLVGSNGGYSNGSLSGTGIIDDPLVNGQASFCRMRIANDGFEFLQVLVDR